jgi:ATP-binding cassette, subfamily F, member 3
MSSFTEAEVKGILSQVIPKISSDESIMEYFLSMLINNDEAISQDYLIENVAPFIESYGLLPDNGEETVEDICMQLWSRLNANGLTESTRKNDEPKLLEKAVVISELAKTEITSKEQETIDAMWGFQKIRAKRNETFEASEVVSSKQDRKATKEQKKFLDSLDSKFAHIGLSDENHNADSEDNDGQGQISAMLIPDLSGKNREKDIHVSNFNITFGGQILLENADLRIVYGRRYGLVGRNGIGKTTLLKHMATFDIEGFPTHHRVLHVKQEVFSSEKSVLQVVLESDVERNLLLEKEKVLLLEQSTASDSKRSQEIVAELTDVYERMELIGVQSAESRAAQILSGLQFTEEMQKSSTSSLSGGWRMRVSLAAALFIEPDLLMLDEPTNHLDLEAVLWLEDYLQSYRHTVLLVSHDRAFLDEVCTDVILFKNQRLTYFRGNFSQYMSQYEELNLVQARQREAQMVKVQHMQEFVDKFRYNAKRASLVQSRIKTLEKETIVEEVEEEVKFQFFFPDAGLIGRPVIEIEGVTFGYDNAEALFRDVHLGVDQSSRVALVGPNGCGKSTLLKLIQNKLRPQEGIIHVNSQLRLGIFTQHHLDTFDLKLSAVENMQNRWPLASEAELRSHLGRFEIHGNDAMKSLKFTSGGQKSRVAFACLTFTKPHVVILDE